jgi:hypothetical protein
MSDAAIKALDNYTLEVLGLPFGEDRQGQYFDATTNIDLEAGQAVPAYFYHGFAERAAKSVARIGKAVYSHADNAGHWFKVQLDAGSDIARRIYEDAKAGLVRASSDSASHLVRPFGIVGKPGKVTNWPIFALSLMDATTSDAAVNPRAIAIAAAKAWLEDIEATHQESSGDDSPTTGEALKAGATFARRNRDRILAIKQALDELLAEFPVESNPDLAATDAVNNGDYSGAMKADAQKVVVIATAAALRTRGMKQ